MRVRARSVFALGVSLIGCDGDHVPCSWKDDTVKDVSTQPTLDLVCNGKGEPIGQQISGFYGSDETYRALNVYLEADPLFIDIHFSGALPDGSYELVSGSDSRDLDVMGASASGVFAFQRSRDVPFVDIEEPEDGVYQSSIVLDFDLTITSSREGCTLRTGPQHVRLVRRGPIEMCNPRRNSHPG